MKIIEQRMSGQLDGDFVVFLIGMRVNRWWKPWTWLRVRAAMPRMLAELEGHPELGYLGGEAWFGRTTIMVQYWRSTAALLAYAISKGGLTTMTRNLADAHALEGLRINQLNPGWVLTQNEYDIKVREGLSPDWPAQIPRTHAPSGRIFKPEEIAHFAAAFLGEEAALVNGSVVDLEQFPLIGRVPVKASGF